MDTPLPPQDKQPQETESLARLAAGDLDAFSELYEKIAPALLTWARLRLSPPARTILDPEEFMQEVWVRALRGLDRFDPQRATFRSWLFGIASLLLIEVLRSVARKQRRPDRRGAAAITPSEVPDAATAVSRHVARNETLRIFAKSIQSLEPTDRNLLLWRGLEGLPHSTVADRLSLSLEACTKRWHRLREHLQTNSLPEDLLET